MQTEPHTAAEQQLPPPSPGNTTDPPFSLAEEGVLKGHCPQHGHVEYWRLDTPVPVCPDCGDALTIVASTARTAAEAIAAAAQQLPEKVERSAHQPMIPGLAPKFDEHAANVMIDGQEIVASGAERDYERSNEQTKSLRKMADAENGKLRKLIQDLRARRKDAEDEASLTPEQRADRRAAGCLWEACTGLRCPVCRNETSSPGDRHVVRHLIDVAAEIDAEAGIDDTTLAVVLREAGQLLVFASTITGWTIDERTEVVNWLDAPDQHERPAILGRAHVIAGDGTQSCQSCGTLLHRLAGEFDLEAFTPGQLVGIDCAGEPEPKVSVDSFQELQHLLAQAGAIVSLDTLAGWTAEECDEASAWAREQFEANERADSGHYSISVKWPEHVSAAHHAASGTREPARRAKPRHATKNARQTAQQARVKADRAEMALAPPARRSSSGSKSGKPRAAKRGSR